MDWDNTLSLPVVTLLTDVTWCRSLASRVEQKTRDNAFPPGVLGSFFSRALTQTRVQDCYQCGKCTAGCPVAVRTDIPPNKVIRLLQLHDFETALRSSAIWECVSCQTCSARCPKSVDCAGLMDALREASLNGSQVPKSQHAIVAFQKAFLDNVRRNGRLAELELIGLYKADVLWNTGRVGVLFKDAGLAPKLNKREKLHLRPGKAKDRGVVERIFARCSEPEER